jgi:hypothetical protein
LTKCVKLVAIAVAAAFSNGSTTTCIHRTRPVANATIVNFTNASIHVVADAIGVRIGSTETTTLSKGIKLVSFTVAVPGRDVETTAVVDLAWSVAHATGVKLSYTWVDVVTDAIGVRIGLTRTAALAEGVELVAVTVAVPRRDAVAATDSALVEDVSVTVTITFRDVVAATLVDLAWSVAHATGVKFSNTWVEVVTDAIGVRIGLTRTATLAKGVKLVSSTIAVARRNALSAANATFIKLKTAAIVICC